MKNDLSDKSSSLVIKTGSGMLMCNKKQELSEASKSALKTRSGADSIKSGPGARAKSDARRNMGNRNVKMPTYYWNSKLIPGGSKSQQLYSIYHHGQNQAKLSASNSNFHGGEAPPPRIAH